MVERAPECRAPGCHEAATWRMGTHVYRYFCEDHVPATAIRASNVAVPL